MTSEPPDQALPLLRWIQEAVNGDPVALRRAFERFDPMIQAEVKRRYRRVSLEQQEEIAQQVSFWLVKNFSTIFKRLEPGRDPGPFIRTVIRRLMNRAIRDLLAAKRKMEVLVDPEILSDMSGDQCTPEEALGARDRLETIRDWAAGLSEVNQTIFWDHIVMRESSKAVGETLGMKPNTVDVRAARIREAFLKWAGRAGLLVLLLLGMLVVARALTSGVLVAEESEMFNCALIGSRTNIGEKSLPSLLGEPGIPAQKARDTTQHSPKRRNE